MQWLALILVVLLDAVLMAETGIPAAFLVPAGIASAGWLIWLLVSDLRSEHRAFRDFHRRSRKRRRLRRPKRHRKT